MKVIVALLILLTIYLNRTYAYYYDYQGTHKLNVPPHPNSQIVNPREDVKPSKLVVLGDSLMSGYAASDASKSLGYLVAQSFNKPINLVNLAYPGVGVRQVLDSQVARALEEKPDYIYIMIGINDIHNLKSISYFKDNYSRILDKLSFNNSSITIVNIPYLGSDLILFPPWRSLLDLRTRQFNSVISDLARARSIKVINLYALKDKFKTPSELYSSDLFHPSDKGYALWAQYIDASSDH